MLRRIAAVLTAFSILVSLSACMGPRTPKNPASSDPISISSSSQAPAAPSQPDTETPEGVTKLVMEAVQTYDVKTLNLYSNSNEGQGVQKPEGTTKTLLDAMVSSLSATVGTAVIDGDTALVPVQITNKDLSGVVGDLAASLVGDMLKNGGVSQDPEVYMEKLSVLIGKKETTATLSAQATLLKKGDSWELQWDEDLLDAVSGGLLSSALGMADKLGGLGLDIGGMLGQ